MALKLVTAPTEAPISLAEAIAHCHAPYDGSDDASLQIYINAAIGHVDGTNGISGHALVDQTWDLFLDTFPHALHFHHRQLIYDGHHLRRHLDREIEIPLPPLIEVIGVYYIDAAGAEQTFDAANYVADTASVPGRVVLNSSASWPAHGHVANAVRIRFRAGFIDLDVSPVATIPYEIKAALLLIIGHLYANRETTLIGSSGGAVEIPWGATQLIKQYRDRAYTGFA